jgi:hypothetical protein
MRTISVTKWTVPALFMALLAMIALAIGTQPAQAVETMTVHVKQASIADHAADCPGGIVGAHFIINQIADGPATIEVMFTDGSSQTVPKSKQSGSAAHYDAFGTSEIADATAEVPTSWTGQFVLSNYICGSTTTSTTSSSSSSAPPTS